jgi:protein-disulfide isomerase
MKKNTQTNSKFYLVTGLLVVCLGALAGIMTQGLFLSPSLDTSQKIIRADGQTYVAVKNLNQDFLVELGKEDNQQLVVYGGKTWLPVPGKPVELTVVNDEACGTNCSPAQAVASLRQGITPALLVRNVDINTSEGKALIDKFELTAIPAFILESSIEDHTTNGSNWLETVGELVIKKDDQYLIDGTKARFPIGKYLEEPDFELAGEPTLGNGKVTVVEFTDYQCPYCKRLHDQNKDLIKRLVAEDKITYIVKDFPLGFHAQAPAVHAAANCAQKAGGEEAYWNMNAKIFENQQTWSGKTEAPEIMKKLALELGIDETAYDTCIADPETLAEAKADLAEGQSFGVTGTPSLFIGTQKMPGAISAEKFEAAVNAELER